MLDIEKEMNESTWDVVGELGLILERPEPSHILVYGSADPEPNPAELMLTQIVASHYKIGWRFFVYKNGKNLPDSVNSIRVNPPGVFYLESIVPEDLSLGDMAWAIWQLRKEPVIVAHLPGGRTIRASSEPSLQWFHFTIDQLHGDGGWLGGSSIHYVLRLWAEKRKDVVFLCPFQQKGRVYRIYAGMERPLFILSPFVKLVPPKRLGLKPWAPTPWWYWKDRLPASYRKQVRKRLKKRVRKKMEQLFSGKPRIEIKIH